MTAMVDTRFHTSSGPISLGVVLSTLGRAPEVDDRRTGDLVITGAEELDLAGHGNWHSPRMPTTCRRCVRRGPAR